MQPPVKKRSAYQAKIEEKNASVSEMRVTSRRESLK